jgi:hypothetical protein
MTRKSYVKFVDQHSPENDPRIRTTLVLALAHCDLNITNAQAALVEAEARAVLQEGRAKAARDAVAYRDKALSRLAL